MCGGGGRGGGQVQGLGLPKDLGGGGCEGGGCRGGMGGRNGEKGLKCYCVGRRSKVIQAVESTVIKHS